MPNETVVAEKTNGTAPPAAAPQAGQEVATISPPRLPYHPAVQERFGIDRASWKALVEAVFPLAKSADSVILALSYCKARKLDPFKRVVHIVPIYDSEQRRMVETIWPGIAELRTTAFRTGQYAGRDPAVYGNDKTETVGNLQITYPEWCQVTVYRFLNGQRIPFPGPRVYWKETYAVTKRDDPSPNSMWRRRPHGQLDKCAEAAALRAAFPEELGNEYAAEEMEGQARGPDHARDVTPPKPTRAEFEEKAAPAPPAQPELYDLIDAQGVIIEPLPSGNFAAKLIDLMTEAGADFHSIYERHADVLAAELFKDVREIYARLSAAETEANKKAADAVKAGPKDEPKDDKPSEPAADKPDAPPAELVIINASAKKESKQKWLANMRAAVPHHPPAAVAEWWAGCKAVIAECEKIDPAGVKALDGAVNDRLAA